jgi:hypothetical protein
MISPISKFQDKMNVLCVEVFLNNVLHKITKCTSEMNSKVAIFKALVINIDPKTPAYKLTENRSAYLLEESSNKPRILAFGRYEIAPF